MSNELEMTHLYKVTMSRVGAEFYVAAQNEGDAARAAEKQWSAWGYYSGTHAIKVELTAWGGQYPPKDGGLIREVCGWFIIATDISKEENNEE